MGVNAKRNKRLKGQFINRINDSDVMTEIIKKLTTIKKTNHIMGIMLGQGGRGAVSAKCNTT